MLKPLSSIERRTLAAARKDAGTRDIRNLRKLKMSMELWYRVNASLVHKGFSNWTEEPDFTDARAGEQSDVITPGLISVTALGREALNENTLSKRVGRALANATPSLLWLVVSTSVGAAVGSVVTFYVTRLLSEST